MSDNQAFLVLADGTVFEGRARGARKSITGEVVFTTGMTGYQEILTDPSYCGQLVTMTAAHIGNTGTNPEDIETEKPAVPGFIVNVMSPIASNWRSTEDLDSYLKRHGIVALCDVDTRALTRHIRQHGAQMAAIGAGPLDELRRAACDAPPMQGRNLTSKVTTDKAITWGQGTEAQWQGDGRRGDRPTVKTRRRVAVIDFGTKQNILRCLVDRGCELTVLPASTKAAEVMALEPHGIFLSNGPGDPAAVEGGIETVQDLVGRRPMFGICLGHQILALALGARSYKLKFGHHGLNHPVKDLRTGHIEITSQNHGFCVDPSTLPKDCEMTHVHLNDDTCMGIEHEQSRSFSVQYHPEASAGPHDSHYLFDRFISAMS